MGDKATYIAHGEALACTFCCAIEGRSLQNTSAIWFVDNLGVLSCFVKGSSHSADVGAIVYATLLATASLRLRVWWEHVESAANLADEGTRGVFTTCGVDLVQRQLPHMPGIVGPDPAEWLRWMRMFGDW